MSLPAPLPSPCAPCSPNEPRFLPTFSRIPRSMVSVDGNLSPRSRMAMRLKNSVWVRHIPVSPPCIGRRRCGAPAPTVWRGHGGIESDSQPPYLSLAWGGARDGEDVSKLCSVCRVWEGRARRANQFKGADHQNRRCVGKSTRRLLEVRAAVGRGLEAKLPAMDTSRTTETAQLDRIAFPARSHCAASALADIGARHVASARSRRKDGPGLVHETRPGGGAA